jgi:transcription elongation factor Elf1
MVVAKKEKKEKRNALKMTTECPLCHEKAFVYEYVSRKGSTGNTGLFIACGFCESKIFSKTGIYRYLADSFPSKTTLRDMTIEEWYEYRKRAGVDK